MRKCFFNYFLIPYFLFLCFSVSYFLLLHHIHSTALIGFGVFAFE